MSSLHTDSAFICAHFAAFTVLLSILNRQPLYCRSNDLVTSIQNPTPYCTISGMPISELYKHKSHACIATYNLLLLNYMFRTDAQLGCLINWITVAGFLKGGANWFLVGARAQSEPENCLATPSFCEVTPI